MNAPSTAREALIVEALGDVATLLERVEVLTSSMEVARLAMDNAGAELGDRLKNFESGLSSVTQQVRAKAVEHIVRRAAESTSLTIEKQARAMNTAARLAFSTQVDSSLAQLATTLRQALHRVDRPWDVWLTHAATAAASAVITWAVVAWVATR